MTSFHKDRSHWLMLSGCFVFIEIALTGSSTLSAAPIKPSSSFVGSHQSYVRQLSPSRRFTTQLPIKYMAFAILNSGD
jgi:hypothetical protein